MGSGCGHSKVLDSNSQPSTRLETLVLSVELGMIIEISEDRVVETLIKSVDVRALAPVASSSLEYDIFQCC